MMMVKNLILGAMAFGCMAMIISACGGKRARGEKSRRPVVAVSIPPQQFFIDNKIPLRDRDRIPLVCKGDEVLVAVGVQISEGVKLTQGTARCACIKSRW